MSPRTRTIPLTLLLLIITSAALTLCGSHLAYSWKGRQHRSSTEMPAAAIDRAITAGLLPDMPDDHKFQLNTELAEAAAFGT